jgi:hypothetical protein
MRLLFNCILLFSALLSFSQSNWNTLFRTNPEQSDGYFIVDQDKAAALGVVQIRIDILGTEVLPTGDEQTILLEQLDITESFYVRTDFSLWERLNDPFRIHYIVEGLDASGNVIVGGQSLCSDCYPWPEVCRETCESNLYAYTLVAYSNGAQAEIELLDGTMNGEALRVYVKGSKWSDFQTMFDPWEHFGLGGGTWSDILLLGADGTAPYATDIIRIQYPIQQPPNSARDYMGLPLGVVTEDVYAVKKGRGPWRDLHATTEAIAAQQVCNGQGVGHLRELFNDDDGVAQTLNTYELDPLTCMGMIAGGSGLTWGTGYNGWCPENDVMFSDLPDAVAEWVINILNCEEDTWPGVFHELRSQYGGSSPRGTYVLPDVSTVVINHWTEDVRTEVISIPVNGIGDPRLLQVTKTEISGGLYEFVLIMNDSRIISRFVEFEGPTILNADFAAFTVVNIYPVPVTGGRFAIDFDLWAPTSINLTIVDNQGTPYYTEALTFDLAGLNKHVVGMHATWPDGLYHAVFQYLDGSSESISFTVEN